MLGCMPALTIRLTAQIRQTACSFFNTNRSGTVSTSVTAPRITLAPSTMATSGVMNRMVPLTTRGTVNTRHVSSIRTPVNLRKRRCTRLSESAPFRWRGFGLKGYHCGCVFWSIRLGRRHGADPSCRWHADSDSTRGARQRAGLQRYKASSRSFGMLVADYPLFSFRMESVIRLQTTLRPRGSIATARFMAPPSGR